MAWSVPSYLQDGRTGRFGTLAVTYTPLVVKGCFLLRNNKTLPIEEVLENKTRPMILRRRKRGMGRKR